MKRFFAIALLALVAGCQKIDCEQAAVYRKHRRYHLREASHRSAAYADSVCGIVPSDTTSTERAEK